MLDENQCTTEIGARQRSTREGDQSSEQRSVAAAMRGEEKDAGARRKSVCNGDRCATEIDARRRSKFGAAVGGCGDERGRKRNNLRSGGRRERETVRVRGKIVISILCLIRHMSMISMVQLRCNLLKILVSVQQNS